MSTLNIKGFPEDLYKDLVNLAKSEHRSLTQEVIFLLHKAVYKTKKQKPSILKFRGLGKSHWKKVSATDHIDKERDSWN